MANSAMPDGVREEHVEVTGRWQRHASPIGVVILGVVLLGAMLGLAGREVAESATSNGVDLRWHAPEVIRSGEVFEMRLTVRSAQPIGDLVLEVPAAIWEDVTINTLIPAAADETSEDGALRFSFGPLDAATEFLFKVDAQINPDTVGPNAGTLRVFDGDRQLVELPAQIEVLP